MKRRRQYYNTVRHAEGFGQHEPRFADKMAALGVPLEPFVDKFNVYNWRVGDVYIDSRGRNIFDDKGHIRFRTIIVPSTKIRWGHEHPGARCVIVWHADTFELDPMRYVPDLLAIADQCLFQKDRPDPVRKEQFEDTHHVPVGLTKHDGWKALAANLMGGHPLL